MLVKYQLHCSKDINTDNFNEPVEIDPSIKDASYLLGALPNFNQPTVVPSTVENASMLFYQDKSLNSEITFEEGIQNLESCLAECIAFNKPINLPYSVVNVNQFLRGAKSFNSIIKLNDELQHLTRTFQGCENLTRIPKLPSNLLSMVGTFALCKKLSGRLIIPKSVRNCRETFYGSNLNLQLIMPENLRNMTSMFENTSGKIMIKQFPPGVVICSRAFYNSTYNIDTVLHRRMSKLEEMFAGKNNKFNSKLIIMNANAKCKDMFKDNESMNNSIFCTKFQFLEMGLPKKYQWKNNIAFVEESSYSDMLKSKLYYNNVVEFKDLDYVHLDYNKEDWVSYLENDEDSFKSEERAIHSVDAKIASIDGQKITDPISSDSEDTKSNEYSETTVFTANPVTQSESNIEISNSSNKLTEPKYSTEFVKNHLLEIMDSRKNFNTIKLILSRR